MSSIENKDVVLQPIVEDVVADGGENNSESNITPQSEGVDEIHNNITLVPNMGILFFKFF
jgi:hypothetical protein